MRALLKHRDDAHEIAAALPEIFRGLRVTQAWAYKYDEAHARGIDAHADQAKVSVNLWITDDAANVGGDDAPGGLVVYDRKPPAEWSFAQANSATDDIDAFKAHLDSCGVAYSDYGTRFARDWHQIFFLDPEGVIVEVHAVQPK